MNPILILAESDDRVADVQEIWAQFTEAVAHPLRDRPFVVRLGRAINDLAWARPLDEGVGSPGALTVASRLLDSKTQAEQFLTLLHETIHLHLLIGEHRDHWNRYRDFFHTNKPPRPGGPQEGDLEFRDRRLRLADLLWGRCDEVYAELYLRTYFEEWAESRAAYLLDMALKTPLPVNEGDELYHFELLYVATKLDLGSRLVGAPPTDLTSRIETVDSKLAPLASAVMSTARKKLHEMNLTTPPESVEPALNKLFLEVVEDLRRAGVGTNTGTSEA